MPPFFLPFSAGIRGPVCLQTLVRLTCDHVELLLTGEVDKLHGVARDTDGEVLVLLLLRMLHGVLEFLHTEDVHVQVVRTLSK